ncbi:MAG: acyl-CoA/acyl-ACP dehydrogenase [Deltaproteobacteria bacterium]|nr:acyl-CoA/acyl-ACP dehydrogenase [Deltaproteobacteria bacterium]
MIEAAALDAALQSGLSAAEAATAALTDALAAATEDPKRPFSLSTSRLHAHGEAAFELARWVAELRASRALLAAFSGLPESSRQRALARYAVAQRIRSVRSAIAAAADLFAGGVDVEVELDAATRAALAEAVGSEATDALAGWILGGGASTAASYALSGDHEDIRSLFRDFADEKVAPLAEHIHREDALLPEELLSAYAEIGALGITIPPDWGGHFIDHRAMALATEELSRASLGAGGSVITRPEIASKALLAGGTKEQKKHWLPRIASGEEIVGIAVTEPGAGSDVASLRLAAEPTEGGWLLNGEKTWCTFAGRASVLLVLARTGAADSGAKGLTLFLVPKPPTKAPADDRSFAHEDGRGGTLSGRAIPTVGYRGMHSFTCFFENWFVPDDLRVGELGGGFVLQMKGFAGGRIQTAARAVGVMEAALRSAVAYCNERRVFGRDLGSLPLVRRKLVDMAAAIALSRQMTLQVCDAMDDHQGDVDASLVKLLACKDAEAVSREAMQLHGGMGYSEEYAVSRYWQDARVLSIFEGAEEVLAILVIARALLRDALAAKAAS